MKRRILSILSFAIVLVIVLGAILNIQFRREIPLVKGLYWGMSPNKVTKILGDSYETEKSNVTDKTAYRYKAVVFGEEAEISCFFWKGKILSDIYIRWDSNTEIIAAQAYDCLYEYYHDKEGFFLNKEDTISLGIDYNGPILRYEIIRNDTTITVSCIDLR